MVVTPAEVVEVDLKELEVVEVELEVVEHQVEVVVEEHQPPTATVQLVPTSLNLPPSPAQTVGAAQLRLHSTLLLTARQSPRQAVGATNRPSNQLRPRFRLRRLLDGVTSLPLQLPLPRPQL